MADASTLEGKLVISSSPHARGDESVPEIMWTVVAALVPAICVAGYVFGYMAFGIIAISVITAVLVEAVVQKALGRRVSVSDGSAVLTGLLLAMTLPPNAQWYVPVVGASVAIFVAKHCFGGLGNNVFNPALVGRAFVHFAFPGVMNQPTWPVLPGAGVASNIASNIHVDGVTTATPLSVLKAGPGMPFSELSRSVGLDDLLWGTTPGCIGETSAIALFFGGAALIAFRHVNWRMPVFYIGTVALLVFALPVPDGTGKLVGGLPAVLGGQFGFARVAAHLLAGGLFLGAFFMATDMVTTPITGRGQIVFAIGAGILVALIRLYGGFPEGVCYSILLMNTATPLIDRHIRPRLFGKKAPEGEAGK